MSIYQPVKQDSKSLYKYNILFVKETINIYNVKKIT